MFNNKNTNAHTYTSILVVPDGPSNEIHFSLRDDGKYIISRCRVLMGGERIYMRSSITMGKDIAIELAKQLLDNLS